MILRHRFVPDSSLGRTKPLCWLIMFSLAVGCYENESAPIKSNLPESIIKRPGLEMDPTQTRIFKTNFAEELILSLTPRLQLLARRFHGEPVELDSLFEEKIQYLGLAEFDLAAAVGAQTIDQNHLLAHVAWPLQNESDETVCSASMIWNPVIRNFKIEDSQFGVVSGVLLEDADIFQMKTTFEGRFLDDRSQVYGVKATQILNWIPTPDGQWKIDKWQQEKLEIKFSPKFLFENVTETAVPNEQLRETLSRSLHEEIIIARTENQHVLKKADRRYPYFSDWQSLQQFPAVSVLDLDQDNWDDLFLMDRWGESVLLRNRGDQTFEDVSDSSGLKLLESAANCALFVDFDNDGDSDALIGRNVEPSLYFRNDNGAFVPDQQINEMLSNVKFVTSGSVADVNRDGLLDVYLSTYCFSVQQPARIWTKKAVREEDRLKLELRLERGHQVLDRGGPPNILLMNRGGKLERVAIEDNLEQWKDSYQSIWTDVDGDGDPDLYVCNDYSADVFLRNDTEPGSFKPIFTEFAEEVFPTNNMAFGMGASLGDYNSDGRLDIYVSNMYSKAGHRVFEQIGGEIDQRILISAAGNFLFENTGDRYQQVAGTEKGQQHVSKVGWSFGGQLADFNNDGHLDVYVPSGFYSAPDPIDAQVDL